MSRKYGYNEITRGNVLKFVEAILALAYGEISIEEGKLENTDTFKIEWIGKDANQLFISGEQWVVKSRRTGLKELREFGTTKKDLWILMKEYWHDDKALILPKNRDNTPVNYQNWDNNKHTQAFQDIFSCLDDLGRFKPDPKHKNRNPRSRYWKFSIQLEYSSEATKEEQLAAIKELVDKKFESCLYLACGVNVNSKLPDLSDVEIQDKTDREKKPIEINKLLESYLIVRVEYDRSPKFFSLMAWLIWDDSVPSKDESRFIPLTVQNQTPKPVVCEYQQIPKQLDNFIKKGLSYNDLFNENHQLTIEIFLPTNLMYMNINSWEIDDPNPDVKKIPLGAKYSTRLRLLERIQKDYKFERSDWRQNWHQVRKFLDKTPTPELFEHLQDQDMENLTPEDLEIKLSKKIGLQVTCCLNKQKVHKLFKCILFTKTPIVVWTGCEIDNHQVDEIDKILMQPLKNLCESVKQTRKKANAAKNEKHLGCHLSLLWDNPYRIPPDVPDKMGDDVIRDLIPPGQ